MPSFRISLLAVGFARPLLLGMTTLAIAAALAGCSSEQKAQAQGQPGAPGAMPAVPVTVKEVTPTQVQSTVEVVGQTEGAREVEVRARVGGILKKRLYEEGAPVHAGQVLFQIDPVPFEIALAQAKAQLAQQNAKLAQAKRERTRLKDLIGQKAVSQREYDDSIANYALAEAMVQAAQATVREAQLNLSYTKVTAPVGGLSGRAARSEGALVDTSANSLLTTIVQANPIWVRFSLSERDLGALRNGKPGQEDSQPVSLLLADGTPYPVKGKLNFAANQVDPQLSTVQLRATFENPDGKLLPGQFVRVRLVTGERDGVFLVPQGAVTQGDQGAFVYVVSKDGKAEVRPVQTGQWQGSNWVVLSGLKSGDRVIVDNLLKVRPGAPVQAQAAPPAGTPAAPAAAATPKA